MVSTFAPGPSIPGVYYMTGASPAPVDPCAYCNGDPVCLSGCSTVAPPPDPTPVVYVPDTGVPVFTAEATARPDRNNNLWLLLLLLLLLWALNKK